MLAADVEAQIDQRKLKAPVVVGHSLGGMIAQTLLRRRPDFYRAAVLSGTSPAFGNPDGDFQKKFVAERLGPLDRGRTMADIAAASADQIMAPNADPANRKLLDRRHGLGLAAHLSRRGQMPRALSTSAPISPQIKVPVLCLVGELDRNAPAAMMQRMAAKIPGARYVCLPGLGHMPNLEAPQAFDAAIFDFLREVRAPIAASSL